MQIKIHLISATSLPARESNGLSDPYVKLHLLPGIAKVSRWLSIITEESIRSKWNRASITRYLRTLIYNCPRTKDDDGRRYEL